MLLSSPPRASRRRASSPVRCSCATPKLLYLRAFLQTSESKDFSLVMAATICSRRRKPRATRWRKLPGCSKPASATAAWRAPAARCLQESTRQQALKARPWRQCRRICRRVGWEECAAVLSSIRWPGGRKTDRF